MEKGIVNSSGECFEKWGSFIYLKANLNMWLKRRARMMVACVWLLLHWIVVPEGGGQLIWVTSHVPRG